MESKRTKTVAQNIAVWLNQYSVLEGTEYKKMVLGIESLLINITKLLFVYALSALLGVVVYTAITQAAYALIRRYALGLHALNSKVCTVVSCLLFVILPWVLQDMGIGNMAVIILFLLIILCLYLYAPADTRARPLIGQKTRTIHKRKAVFCGILLMGVAVLMPTESVKLLIALGAAYQVISILPLTYKILKRSEKNYEKYE